MFGLFGTLIFVLSLAIGRLYHVELSGSRLKEFGQVVEALVIGFFVYVGLIYFTNGVVYEIPIPRLLLLFAFFLCVLGTVMARVVLDIIQLYGLRK